MIAPSKALCVSTVVAAMAIGMSPVHADSVVLGEYVEVRTRDVWWGPSVERRTSPTGEFAVLCWSISRGTWERQDLAGLKAAAAIRVDGSLADLENSRLSCILYVDEKADKAQTEALVSLVRALAKKYVVNVLEIKKASVRFSLVTPDHGDEQLKVEIPKVLDLRTEIADHEEGVCACASSKADLKSMAKTSERHQTALVKSEYRCSDLVVRAKDPNRTQVLLGTFSL